MYLFQERSIGYIVITWFRFNMAHKLFDPSRQLLIHDMAPFTVTRGLGNKELDFVSLKELELVRFNGILVPTYYVYIIYLMDMTLVYAPHYTRQPCSPLSCT